MGKLSRRNAILSALGAALVPTAVASAAATPSGSALLSVAANTDKLSGFIALLVVSERVFWMPVLTATDAGMQRLFVVDDDPAAATKNAIAISIEPTDEAWALLGLLHRRRDVEFIRRWSALMRPA